MKINSVITRIGALWLLSVPFAFAQTMDASGYDALLRARVTDGVVDYPAIAADARLAGFISELAKPVTLNSREEKLVYYMNAYNALAIKGILDGLSPGSFFGRQRYFKLTNYRLNGLEINLDSLEHKTIRPLGEPRVHFSIVCASRSCPRQRSDAYTTAKLETQLDENARGFINDNFRNRFDKQNRIANLSEIFKWFEEDFVKSAGSVQKFIARYVADPEVARELAGDGYQIKYIAYDWNLNGIPPPGK